MLKSLIQKIREKKRGNDGVKYYQNPYSEDEPVNHCRKRPSYKMNSQWKVKSPWKYDSWKN